VKIRTWQGWDSSAVLLVLYRSVASQVRTASYDESVASSSRDLSFAKSAIKVVLRRLTPLPASPDVEALREKAAKIERSVSGT
jgi:hypothetical protein